jgi:hypothetical protein
MRRISCRSVAIPAILVIVAFVFGASRAGKAGPVFLNEDECGGLIGGENLCPTMNCACASQSCNTTGVPPQASCVGTATCASDGHGGCIKTVMDAGSYCGQPDTTEPNGCNDLSVGQCGEQFTGGPDGYYGDCAYPNLIDCKTAGNACGQTLYNCRQN